MDISVIKSYLVELGFQVDHPQLSAFNDALRKTAAQVERFTTGTFGIAGMFVKAGAAITTTLTGIAGATLGLLDHVAASDLGFQVMARRMFVSVDAARSLKTATDALGYSLEDVIWGPKELRERFGVLIGDQKTLAAGLGPDFEKQMKGIRDIRFEFTRLEVAVKYGVMGLAANIARSLFGDDISGKLHERVNKFMKDLPEIAQQISTYLVPVLKDVGEILKDIFAIGGDVASVLIRFVGALYGDGRLDKGKVSIENVGIALDHVSHSMRVLFDDLKIVADYIAAHPWLAKIIGGAAAGGVLGSVIPGVGTLGGAVIGGTIGAVGGGIDASGELSKSDAIVAIIKMAKSMGLDPAAALAIASKESDFNANAVGDNGQAIGMFQLHEGAAKMGGITDRSNPSENIKGGIGYLLYLHKKYRGDWMKVFEAYNGGEGNVDRGTVSGAARDYAQDAMKNFARERMAIGDWSPIAYNGTGTHVGTLNIHITEPHATPAQIHRVVKAALEDSTGKQTQRTILQNGAVFA